MAEFEKLEIGKNVDAIKRAVALEEYFREQELKKLEDISNKKMVADTVDTAIAGVLTGRIKSITNNRIGAPPGAVEVDIDKIICKVVEEVERKKKKIPTMSKFDKLEK